MVRRLNIALNDSDYDEIKAVKENIGLSREEFVNEAAECLHVRGAD